MKPYAIEHGEGKFCSLVCRNIGYKTDRLGSSNHQYGTHWQSGKGNPNYKGVKPFTCIDCNKILNGRNKRLRCRACNYKHYTGPNHYMWIPDKVRLYPASWNSTYKWQIRHRDGYKCQICGVSQAECKTHLPVHHIDYDKFNTKQENLVTLCNSCHAKTNFRREYWKQYFLRGGDVDANSVKSQA